MVYRKLKHSYFHILTSEDMKSYVPNVPAASQVFVEVSNEDVFKFLQKMKTKTLPKKTKYDLAIFRDYLRTIGDERNIEKIPVAELQNALKKFILAVRKKNGEEYEPSSIRAILQSIDRYLKNKK